MLSDQPKLIETSAKCEDVRETQLIMLIATGLKITEHVSVL